MQKMEPELLENDKHNLHNQYVVHKSIEPGVINDEMLHKSIRANGPRGEAARLCRNIPIEYEAITELALEFQNILKIDHLWMLVNLQKLSLKCNKIEKIENLDNLKHLCELDLSFNCIKVIENLECLNKLEYLTLFRNNIRSVDNLVTLESLVRLNIGNNAIDTVNGIERLRFNGHLYSLNLEGNPIADKLDDGFNFRCFIAAFFPNLKYYNYSIIMDDERKRGREIFKSDLRMLEEVENEEIALKQKQIAADDELHHLTMCFIEGLSKHDLFDLLFKNDKNASEHSLDSVVKQYRDQVYTATQEIYNLGLQHHERQNQELKQFDAALAMGTKEHQSQGITLNEQFEFEISEIVSETTECFHSMSAMVKNKDDEKINEKRCQIDVLSENFATIVDNYWYELMGLETTLHELIGEANRKFNKWIQAVVQDFLIKTDIAFQSIQLACEKYFQRLSASHESILKNSIASSRNLQLAIIDQRSKSLNCAVKKWLVELLENYDLREYNRNREKILEISSFVDAKRTAHSNLKDNLINKFNLQSYFFDKM